MFLCCCAWSIPGNDQFAIRQIAELGFQRIDVRPSFFARQENATFLRQQGMNLSCFGISDELPPGASFSAEPYSSQSQKAISFIEKTLPGAAALGADRTYLVPDKNSEISALKNYALNIAKAADIASKSGIKLCIEHFPGTALPSVSSTLDFIDTVDHPNIFLLLDIGHCLISDEDPADCVQKTGGKLGGVHLDDNDGVSDLHLSLLEGVLTLEALSRIISALSEVQYRGPLSFELSPALKDPAGAIRESLKTISPLIPKLNIDRKDSGPEGPALN